jgi:hypothetical protein
LANEWLTELVNERLTRRGPRNVAHEAMAASRVSSPVSRETLALLTSDFGFTKTIAIWRVGWMIVSM